MRQMVFVLEEKTLLLWGAHAEDENSRPGGIDPAEHLLTGRFVSFSADRWRESVDDDFAPDFAVNGRTRTVGNIAHAAQEEQRHVLVVPMELIEPRQKIRPRNPVGDWRAQESSCERQNLTVARDVVESM